MAARVNHGFVGQLCKPPGVVEVVLEAPGKKKSCSYKRLGCAGQAWIEGVPRHFVEMEYMALLKQDRATLTTSSILLSEATAMDESKL